MNCEKIRQLLEANADGELDLVGHLELEAHLRACPECARRAEGIRARRNALRESLPRFTAPPRLRERILAQSRAEAVAAAPPPRRFRTGWPLWNLAGMAASLAFALLIGFAWGQARSRANSIWEEAASAHVRSLQTGHLMDVASTDQHTVKPWFAGKIDFSPPVTDLAEAGFPLVGGRLERIDGREAAALVYHRRLHTINVFVWPAADAPLSPGRRAKNGYNAESWTHAGLNFLAVSEIPAAELDQFVGEFRKKTE